MALIYSTAHQMFVIGVVLALAFYDRTSADELVASGSSSMDATNERVQRLEMQMSRLQRDMSSMENVLGEILLALHAESADEQQELPMSHFYEIKRNSASSGGNVKGPSFLGSRGKKMVFLGSRGKRNEFYAKRLQFLGSRGRRGGNLPSFYGSRG